MRLGQVRVCNRFVDLDLLGFEYHIVPYFFSKKSSVQKVAHIWSCKVWDASRVNGNVTNRFADPDLLGFDYHVGLFWAVLDQTEAK